MPRVLQIALCFLLDYGIILAVIGFYIFLDFFGLRDSTPMSWFFLFFIAACIILCPIKKAITIKWALHKRSKLYHFITNVLSVPFALYFTFFILYWAGPESKSIGSAINKMVEITVGIYQEYFILFIIMALLALGFFLSDLYCKKIFTKEKP